MGRTAFWPFAQPSHALLYSRSHGRVSFMLASCWLWQPVGPTALTNLLCVLDAVVASMVLMSSSQPYLSWDSTFQPLATSRVTCKG